MWQQGQVFKLKARGGDVSRFGRTATGLRAAARRGRGLAASRLALTHRRRFGR
jgi:hypothetical protein